MTVVTGGLESGKEGDHKHRHRLLDAWARGIVMDKVADGMVDRIIIMVGFWERRKEKIGLRSSGVGT